MHDLCFNHFIVYDTGKSHKIHLVCKLSEIVLIADINISKLHM